MALDIAPFWVHALITSSFILSWNGVFASSGPYLVDWSDKTYGPDGPTLHVPQWEKFLENHADGKVNQWHAVNVSIGTPPQFVDLLLGRIRASAPLATTNCNDFVTCPSQKGGYYDYSKSSTVATLPDEVASVVESKLKGPGSGFGGPVHTYATYLPVSDVMRLYSNSDVLITPDTGVEIIINPQSTTTNTNTTYPMTLGYLCLGAPFSAALLYHETPQYPTTFIHEHLYRIGLIASPSMAVHVGSPSLGIPPSMVLGGYDRSRVLGRVISQQIPQDIHLRVNLIDMGFGTEFGPSQFDPSGMSGLLADSEGPATGLTAVMGFTLPYLFMPKTTCDAIAKYLPIKFDAEYGVYLWTLDDPRFKQIMSTPSFIYFKFQAVAPFEDFMDAPVTIKVPLNLLNLSLELPIAAKPTPYFPCAPIPPTTQYYLGRAFLQAATVVINWGTSEDPTSSPGSWSLSQAPGPDVLDPLLSSIVVNQTSVFGDGDDWERSWRTYWDNLNQNGSIDKNPPLNATLPAPENSGGLSVGAEAGIGAGIGVVVVAILVSAAICFVKRRHRHQRRAQPPDTSPALPYPKTPASLEISHSEEQEHSPSTIHELPSPDSPAHYGRQHPLSSEYSSPLEVPGQAITTQYATAPYDPESIISPISSSPWSPSPWSAVMAVEPTSPTPPQAPPPAYPELEADRGAELEAPRQVEKSGFLVA